MCGLLDFAMAFEWPLGDLFHKDGDKHICCLRFLVKFNVFCFTVMIVPPISTVASPLLTVN